MTTYLPVNQWPILRRLHRAALSREVWATFDQRPLRAMFMKQWFDFDGDAAVITKRGEAVVDSVLNGHTILRKDPTAPVFKRSRRFRRRAA